MNLCDGFFLSTKKSYEALREGLETAIFFFIGQINKIEPVIKNIAVGTIKIEIFYRILKGTTSIMLKMEENWDFNGTSIIFRGIQV